MVAGDGRGFVRLVWVRCRIYFDKIKSVGIEIGWIEKGSRVMN
jgi:hypothetical protein